MRWMNRIATVTILLAIIAGPPLLTTVWLLHHPWQPPQPDQLRAWTSQPLTADTIIAGCIATAAAGWLLLVWQVTRRAQHHLVRNWRRLRRLPLPTPAQMTASSMAGVAALTFPHTDAGPTGPPPPERTTDHHTDRQQPPPQGIALPGGGWIPYPTALAVTAVVALIWRQSRRHYHPDRARLGTHHTDPDLQPLPATVDAISATLDNTPPAATPAGTTLIDDLPTGVLLLEGPGATAAARGLLITTALAAITAPPTTGIRIRAGDLQHILPGLDPRHPHLTDLLADEETREPLEPERGEDPLPANSREAPLTHRPAPPHTTIVLDASTAATTRWHIAVDGNVTEHGTTGRHRLCLLDQTAAADLLDLVHRARTPTGHHTPMTTPPEARPAVPNPADKPRARLVLLGTCQLTVADKPVKLRRTAGLQILAYLAVHPDGATRTELTHAIWPELPPATIGQRLHTTLADLRKQLRPLLGDNPVIRLDDRYHLNRNAINPDVQDLWATTRGTADNSPAALPRQPHEPCELAAGWTWPWLTAAREALRRDIMDANTEPGDTSTARPRP
jgi:hypothetical protein